MRVPVNEKITVPELCPYVAYKCISRQVRNLQKSRKIQNEFCISFTVTPICRVYEFLKLSSSKSQESQKNRVAKVRSVTNLNLNSKERKDRFGFDFKKPTTVLFKFGGIKM